MSASLSSLMEPTSIAIVGATSREPAMGNTVLKNFRRMGFGGRVSGVHPREREVEGITCYRTVEEVPQPVQAVVLALRRELIPKALAEAGEAGVEAAVVFASGFGEAADGHQLDLEVKAVANDYGMHLAGPNCLGLVNVTAQLPLYSSALPDIMEPGGVALVSQSGSGCIGLICSGRLNFSHVVSAGNELITTTADYLAFLAMDEHTRVIAMILETVRDPEGFAKAALTARSAGKPVVVLKAGRSQRGREAAAAHTGALIGSSEEYDAFFRSIGIVQVEDLDELIETALIWSKSRLMPGGHGLGVISLSGGENALLLDAAMDLQLEFPDFASTTKATLAKHLPNFAQINNPLDATGTAVFDQAMYGAALAAVGNDPGVDVVGVVQDAPPGLDSSHQRSVAASLRTVAKVARSIDKPFVVISNIGGGVHATPAKELEDTGVPLLTGTRESLRALSHFVSWPPAVREGDLPSNQEANRRSTVEPRFSGIASFAVVMDLLSAYDVPCVPMELARDLDGVLEAGERIGYPVALKLQSSDIPHKTEVGAVRLDIRDESQLRRAFSEVEAAITRENVPTQSVEGFLVQKMVSGIEAIVGARVSPTFGPLVLLGTGGIFVELHRDTTAELAPVSVSGVEAMIDRLALSKLLAGFRGSPPGDRKALAEVVSRFSWLVWDMQHEIEEADLNPLVVLPRGDGVCVVDSLVVRKDHG
jgi:acyl-CoA synthetase (NDP forming)